MKNLAAKSITKQYLSSAGWGNWIIGQLSDDDLKKEISPGKNPGTWLLGHLIACEDDFALYIKNEKATYPEYQKWFAYETKPQAFENYPPISEMRDKWKEMVEKNKKIYAELTDEVLNEPHARLTDENDFCQTKHDIAVHWQVHLMYHVGQLSVLIPKAVK